MGEENDEPGEDGQQLRDWNGFLISKLSTCIFKYMSTYLGTCIYGCNYIFVYVGIFLVLKHAYVS